MTLVARTRSLARVLALTLAFLAAGATPARADITAFLGLSPTPDNHAARGIGIGVSILIVGFEFEYSNVSEDDLEQLPGLRTYSGNVLVQTPTSTQLYATAGAGGYQETLGDRSETNFGLNLGGGVKISLIGPLRVRLDYRLFTLKGSPIHSSYQRFYAGANIAF